MKFQRYATLVLILLVCMISISAVNAADDSTSGIISTSDNEELILDEIISDDVSTSTDADDIELNLADNDDVDEIISSTEEPALKEEQTGSFTDLNNLIASGNADNPITLNRNYKYTDDDSDFNNGININHAIIINGAGFTIDGSNKARIFNITSDNVIFNDITFINAYRIGSNGGAITGDCTAINCNFINNTAELRVGITDDGTVTFFGSGGAMMGGTAINCNFINNTAGLLGGAMFGGNAINCNFINNTADQKGGAIYQGYMTLCKFVNNEYYDTGITSANFIALDFTSTYNSGEKLIFNVLADKKLYDGLNTTIKVYQGDNLVGTYYGLSGNQGGWAPNLNPENIKWS